MILSSRYDFKIYDYVNAWTFYIYMRYTYIFLHILNWYDECILSDKFFYHLSNLSHKIKINLGF